MKKKFKLFVMLFMIAMIFTGCIPKVTPNEFVVVTADCWNHMEVISAGQVPPRMLTQCDRKIVIPAYLMDGETLIPARFQGDVKGILDLDYQYTIIDPIEFVTHAKFITSSGTDEEGHVDHNTLERAENTVIDKTAKDVAREYIPTVNPVNIDEGKIESDIVPLINKRLLERGIVMSGASINIEFGEQTEQALDAISALNLYKNAGSEEIGKEVIKAQAGRPMINFPTPVTGGE